MADHFDDDCAQADAGASQSYPQQCSALRKGGHVLIKGKPCKIVETSTSKTGKHGHAKVHLVGLDIFTGKKYEDICPSTHNMEVPNVTRKELEVISLEDEFLSLMDDEGNIREDLKVADEDMSKKCKTMLEAADSGSEGSVMATVWKAMGEEKILELKHGKKN